MNMSVYKSNTIVIPSYNDGFFDLYAIKQNGAFPVEYLSLIARGIAFKMQSVGDKLKYELKERNVNIEFKIIMLQRRIK